MDYWLTSISTREYIKYSKEISVLAHKNVERWKERVLNWTATEKIPDNDDSSRVHWYIAEDIIGRFTKDNNINFKSRWKENFWKYDFEKELRNWWKVYYDVKVAKTEQIRSLNDIYNKAKPRNWNTLFSTEQLKSSMNFCKKNNIPFSSYNLVYWYWSWNYNDDIVLLFHKQFNLKYIIDRLKENTIKISEQTYTWKKVQCIELKPYKNTIEWRLNF